MLDLGFRCLRHGSCCGRGQGTLESLLWTLLPKNTVVSSVQAPLSDSLLWAETAVSSLPQDVL